MLDVETHQEDLIYIQTHWVDKERQITTHGVYLVVGLEMRCKEQQIVSKLEVTSTIVSSCKLYRTHEKFE